MAEKKKKSGTSIVQPSPAVWAGVDSFRVEDDHRTMAKAGEIKADRDRMKAVKKMHKNMEKVCK